MIRVHMCRCSVNGGRQVCHQLDTVLRIGHHSQDVRFQKVTGCMTQGLSEEQQLQYSQGVSVLIQLFSAFRCADDVHR